MKLVTINKFGEHYPCYKEWINRISYKHAHLYVENSAPQKDRVYVEIISGEHSYQHRDISLSLIQDLITKQVYIINSDALFDLTQTFKVEPQNGVIMRIVPVTIQEVVNMLGARISEIKKDLSHQTYGSQMIYRAIEINLLERVIDSFTDKFDLTEIILYTAEDVQDLIDAITDEADYLADNLFETMDLSEIESPIMKVLNRGE